MTLETGVRVNWLLKYRIVGYMLLFLLYFDQLNTDFKFNFSIFKNNFQLMSLQNINSTCNALTIQYSH